MPHESQRRNIELVILCLGHVLRESKVSARVLFNAVKKIGHILTHSVTYGIYPDLDLIMGLYKYHGSDILFSFDLKCHFN